jgi:hypothetical protein
VTNHPVDHQHTFHERVPPADPSRSGQGADFGNWMRNSAVRLSLSITRRVRAASSA